MQLSETVPFGTMLVFQDAAGTQLASITSNGQETLGCHVRMHLSTKMADIDHLTDKALGEALRISYRNRAVVLKLRYSA